MNAPVKTDNPNVIGIKHMAFAVKDARKAHVEGKKKQRLGV